MKFEELPNNIRVKLKPESEKWLWKTVGEFGGVKQFADTFGFSASKMYNWKNKEGYVPIRLVKRILGSNCTDDIVAIKGGGRSKPLETPEFPMPENDELLTRIDESVNVNQEGVPVYQTDDRGLADRFMALLEIYGDVPVKRYNRGFYQVRYPKYMHQIFEEMDFRRHLPALIDEKGRIEDELIKVEEVEIPVEDFDEQLYSRDKRLELALSKGNSEKVAEIMAEEADKVRGMTRDRS